MQISNINSANSFGAIFPPVLPPVPPAIVRECSPAFAREGIQTGWLNAARTSILKLREQGIIIDKTKTMVDVFDSTSGSSLGTLQRPNSPKKLEDFVGFIKEIRKEVAEYTDSKIKIVGRRRNSDKIKTLNLKASGRTIVDKSPIIRRINQPS